MDSGLECGPPRKRRRAAQCITLEDGLAGKRRDENVCHLCVWDETKAAAACGDCAVRAQVGDVEEVRKGKQRRERCIVPVVPKGDGPTKPAVTKAWWPLRRRASRYRDILRDAQGRKPTRGSVLVYVEEIVEARTARWPVIDMVLRRPSPGPNSWPKEGYACVAPLLHTSCTRVA